VSDETVRLSMIGRVLRGRLRLLVVLAIVGALVGAGASLVFSPGYEATASVLLQGPRQADELLTEAQVATSSVVLNRAAKNLGLAVTDTKLKDSITASVANGNVVAITAAATSADGAQRLADQVAQEFVKYSTQLLANTANAAGQSLKEQQDSLRAQVLQTAQQITALSRSVTQGLTVESVQARTSLEALRTSLDQAMNNLSQVDAATSQGNMVVMGPAERPSSPAAPTLTQLIGGGAILFFLLGLLGHLFSFRADKRLRTESDIADALGSPVLAALDVGQPSTEDLTPGAHSRFAWLRRLLGQDKPWNIPQVTVTGDELNRDVRYRRVLTRLSSNREAGMRVLVVVPDGDIPARRAVAQLAVTAAATGSVSVVTDLEDFQWRVDSAADGTGRAAPRVRFPSEPELGNPRTTFLVADVDFERPVVADGGEVSGALLVLTVGTRTALELVGIAEACVDAGHEVLGAVLIQPVRPGGEPRPKKEAKAPQTETVSQADADRDAMAGSA
jgi:capsular polysaccharide biosynthesis protein